MSDIPIGTPPSPPGRHAAPGGWYPDPIDAGQERYWDGWQWSRNTRPRATPGLNPWGQPYDSQQPPGSSQSLGSQQPYGGQRPDQQYGGQQYGAQQPSQQYGDQQPAPPGYGPNQPAPYRAAPLGGSAQAAYTADGVPLSGWWWRALAVCLDWLFVSILVAIPAFPIYQRMVGAMTAYLEEVFRATQAGQPAPPQLDPTTLLSRSDQLALLAIQIGVALLFHIAFLRWKGATPGKLICRLKVVPVDQGQSPEPLAWGSVVVRAMIWVLPGISAYLMLFRALDVLFPLWQPKRQALHDLAARTQVIRRP